MNWGFVRGTWREFKSPLDRIAIFPMASIATLRPLVNDPMQMDKT